MQLSKMKNIIVLKGMASNVVDEAIVVLKPNVKIKQYNKNGVSNQEEKNKKMIVVREAETTIHHYVKKLQTDNKKREETNLRKKYKFLQVFNAALIISIIILAITSL